MKIARLSNGAPEIYLAIQGEGFTMGKPVVFIRTLLCNLHCEFCDTSYTWNFEETPWVNNKAKKTCRKNVELDMTPGQIADKIREVCEGNESVVFTGGEPTLQQTEIVEVMKKLGLDWHYEIETNGTFKLNNFLCKNLTQINCSPKLKSSNNEGVLNNKIAEQFHNELCGKNVFFKFVVCKNSVEQDLTEIDEWVKVNKIPKQNIYLMPEGTESKDIIEGTKYLINICQKTGYNLSTRLQVILFGSKRAV